ncbi:uncharacterized protein PGTG_00562 [Puccinia graminis f. sp. tritici CRL 75-36-700-3]|uniref:GAG-pre-integrase domain-containing protein n=1 Tax=Puccinia graminis f. sp. tritici (strain CRL 75-36-700-3 / race SCCL) TaxID=418459 RepID=E3JRE2_PUCGT|nr:uncharacterized protein PGTG_00562 [Puccinia graminis f. sp. tritici CRL 75-36-700-3]EFP74606.1 hypothetical protein PGTG_00562 [Puccinia graminis f. sp. tritici CRL 75-36-700-3]
MACTYHSPSEKASSKPKAAKQGQAVRHCSFCNLDGHDLNRCFNVARLIENHKSTQAQPKNKKSASNRVSSSTSTSNYPAKAGRISAAILGDQQSGDESDFSGSELEIRAGHAAVSLSVSSPQRPIPSGDANLDSGCSISMTPDLNAISFAKPNNTPVRLADHSTVEASHKGISCLPLKGLCDTGLTAVFTPTSCDIYSTVDTKVSGSLVGRGYRRGILFYLPSQPVGHPSSSLTLDKKVDNTLLGYHQRFSHIGLQPLKALLKSQGNNSNVVE